MIQVFVLVCYIAHTRVNLFRVMVGLESIPAVTGREMGYTLTGKTQRDLWPI